MKLVFGIGINDAIYPTQRKLDKWICPYYKVWKSMLGRCYYDSEKYLPYYKDITVCEDWKYFSNFRAWMEKQNWEGLELDKDILVENNTIYSPSTCCFVPKDINMLLTDRKAARGEFPIGVSFNKQRGLFAGYVVDFKQIHLGYFSSPEAAHQAWRLAKASVIERRVGEWSLQESFNESVGDALLKRASDLKQLTQYND